MKRSAPIPRKTRLARGGRVKPVNRKRRASEFARCYGSKERVAWVKSLPCAVRSLGLSIFAMPCHGPMDNAHTVTGGMGRKADAETIIPLCRRHHEGFHAGRWDPVFVQAARGYATEVEQRWRAEGGC